MGDRRIQNVATTSFLRLITTLTCGGPLLLLKVRRTCLFSPGSQIALLSFKAPRSFTPLFRMRCLAGVPFLCHARSKREYRYILVRLPDPQIWKLGSSYIRDQSADHVRHLAMFFKAFSLKQPLSPHCCSNGVPLLFHPDHSSVSQLAYEVRVLRVLP